MGHMTNFEQMSLEEKIDALENEISSEEYYLEKTSQPHKVRNRVRYIKDLKSQLKHLINNH